jgi:hypothetical protein
MEALSPDKVWQYKNFNMVLELDIAGEFIYDGIHTLNQMKAVNEETNLFSFLYHTAVGIERLQKIILVLFEPVDVENHKEFEEGLITHSHTELHHRITVATKLEFNARENKFLHVLTGFYNSARYDRFNLDSQFAKEQELFSDYLVEQIGIDKIEYDHFHDNVILLTPKIKEILGRIIGVISKKYYELVCEGCKRTGTFTYELRTDSKAEKIFRSTSKSLQHQKINEKLALKEFLICLRRCRERAPLLHYMDNITPLDFDPALFGEYIYEICNGNIPQELVDEAEHLYGERKYSKNREKEVDAIGKPSVDFDFYVVHQCFLLMDDLLNGSKDYMKFVNNFPNLFEMIDEDERVEEIDAIPSLCESMKKNEISYDLFIKKIEQCYIELKKYYNFDDRNK